MFALLEGDPSIEDEADFNELPARRLANPHDLRPVLVTLGVIGMLLVTYIAVQVA